MTQLAGGLLLKELKYFEVMLNELQTYEHNYFLCAPQKLAETQPIF